MTPIPFNLFGLAVSFSATLLLLLSLHHLRSTQGIPDTATENIPNQAHFVYILENPDADFAFQFSHFLSIYAAWHYWRPHTLYLHTNARDGPISRARDGLSGKWNKLIFRMPGLAVNDVPVPSHADNGAEIQNMEHKSDFVRVKAVRDFGGVYIDFDVHPLRDIKVLRQSGFNAIGGRQLGGEVNSGTFLSTKGGKMIRQWTVEMHQVYNGGWTTHSNEVITRVGERLVAEPREMLIMEREAFAPGSWNADDCSKLFEAHNDSSSNLDNINQGDPLPSNDSDDPPWAWDWSKTYLLHAFKPDRWGYDIKGFDSITPRYVLERRSNFARAVYPIAKLMYEKGLIAINDSHSGL